MATGDMITLAFNGAASEIGVNKEEGKKALRTLLKFYEVHQIWPKEFMP